MLIGVLCEVVSSVAEGEKEGLLIQYVTARFQVILEDLDADGTGTLSKDEFLSIMTNKEAWEALEEVDVDPISLVKLVDLIFETENADDKGHLTFPEFMDVILSFRGSNTATVKDINNLRKWLDGHLHRHVMETQRMFKNLLALP